MFPLDRSLSPFPGGALIPRHAHHPWPHHPLSPGPAIVSVQERALHILLPDLAHPLLTNSHDAGSLIDTLILSSPELPPTTQWNPLDEHELRRAYIWVIEAISRASHSEVEIAVVDGLMEALESRLSEDSGAARMMDQPFFHQRTQHLFRCMAEVSRVAKSLKLGNVLAQFFVAHARGIASVEHSMALGQWCYAVLRGTMRQSDRVECLRRVLAQRPDLPSKLMGRGRKAAEVAENLEIIGGGMQLGRREVHVREGLALDNPFLGVGGVRQRSLSRGRRDVFGGLHDFGLRDDGDELARQAERLMLAQEDAAHESRRMVQLSLGRRYGDLLGRGNVLAVGGIGGLRGGLRGLGGGLGGLGLDGLAGLRGLGAASPLGLDNRRLRLEDALMDEI